jgi:hypothetical protein
MTQNDLFVVDRDLCLPLPWEKTATALAGLATFHPNGKLNVHFPRIWTVCPETRDPIYGEKIQGFWGMQLIAEFIVHSKDRSYSEWLNFLLPLTTSRGTWRFAGQELIPPFSDQQADALIAFEIERLIESPHQYGALFSSHAHLRPLGRGRLVPRAQAIKYHLESHLHSRLMDLKNKSNCAGRNGLSHLNSLSKANRLHILIPTSESTTQILKEALPIADNNEAIPEWIGGSECAILLKKASTLRGRTSSEMPHITTQVQIDPNLQPGMGVASKDLLKAMRSVRLHDVRIDGPLGAPQRTRFRCPKVGDPLAILNPTGHSPSIRIVESKAGSGKWIRVHPRDAGATKSAAVVALRDSRSFETALADLHPDLMSSDALSAELNRRIEAPPRETHFGPRWQAERGATLNRVLALQSLLAMWSCALVIDEKGLGVQSITQDDFEFASVEIQRGSKDFDECLAQSLWIRRHLNLRKPLETPYPSRRNITKIGLPLPSQLLLKAGMEEAFFGRLNASLSRLLSVNPSRSAWLLTQSVWPHAKAPLQVLLSGRKTVPGVGTVPPLVHSGVKPGSVRISPDLFRSFQEHSPRNTNATVFGARPLSLRKIKGEGIANVVVHPEDAALLNAPEVICFSTRSKVRPKPHSRSWLEALERGVRSSVTSGRIWPWDDLVDSKARVAIDHPSVRRVLGDLSKLGPVGDR